MKASIMSWVLEIKLRRKMLDQASLWLWSREEVQGVQEKPGKENDFFEPQKGNDVVEYHSKEHEIEKKWLHEEKFLENTPFLYLNVFVSISSEPDREKFLEDFLENEVEVEEINWVEIQDRDYIEEYKKNVVPSRFGDGIWVGPPWMDVPADVKVSFQIDPGMAFGTGEHPTTQMCLESLQNLAKDKSFSLQKGFLDLGCGTGILSLGIRKFFPHVPMVVSDLDPLCRDEFAKNFNLNKIASSDIVQSWGTDAHCSEILKKNYSFDCVVSNIYAEVLAELSSDVAQLLRPGGRWIASGILEGKSSEKLLASLPSSFTMLEEHRRTYKEENWLCYVWENKGS